MNSHESGPRDRDSGGGREIPVQIPERGPSDPTKRTPDGSQPPRGDGDDEED